MDKRPSSTKLRREVFDHHKKVDETGRIFLVCWICGAYIDPVRDKWDADHTVRRVLFKGKGYDAMAVADSVANVLPAHERCHEPKTIRDIKENAKGKRVSDRHYGIKRAVGWNRRFKKKLSGKVVER